MNVCLLGEARSSLRYIYIYIYMCQIYWFSVVFLLLLHIFWFCLLLFFLPALSRNPPSFSFLFFPFNRLLIFPHTYTHTHTHTHTYAHTILLLDHHWLVKPVSGPTKYVNEVCPNSESFAYVFGVGAESRNTPTDLPTGYGYEVKSGTQWGANIHLLHSEGISGGQQGIKECIECWATPSRLAQGHGCTPKGNGSFSCCGSGGGGDCAQAFPDPVPTEYRLVMYIEYTRDLIAITPADVAVFRTPNCRYEYNVGDSPSTRVGDVNVVSETWKVPAKIEAIFGIAHMHTGAINVSVSLKRKGLFDKFLPVCTSYPVYGQNGTAAGDEAGHVVAVTLCLREGGTAGGSAGTILNPSAFHNGTLVVNEGDELMVQGYYAVGDVDPRIAPVPAGPHLGVMSYFYVVYKKPSTTVPVTAGTSGWSRLGSNYKNQN